MKKMNNRLSISTEPELVKFVKEQAKIQHVPVSIVVGKALTIYQKTLKKIALRKSYEQLAKNSPEFYEGASLETLKNID